MYQRNGILTHEIIGCNNKNFIHTPAPHSHHLGLPITFARNRLRQPLRAFYTQYAVIIMHEFHSVLTCRDVGLKNRLSNRRAVKFNRKMEAEFVLVDFDGDHVRPPKKSHLQ